jgi:dCMP deaminase|tara:strand:+ start:1538 stop:1981 length:444 start_codon:yes stop_codon:yes gene_type:complete
LSSKWDSRYISLAQEVSTWSKDPSTKIGAVAIGEKGQVLAQGYNGFPRGIDDNDDRYYNKEQKYKYVVHAEMNCIYNATYNGVSLQGATIYISGLPVCSECAKGLIQVGIKRVVYHTGLDIIPKKWIESNDDTIKLFDEAGVTYDRI